MNDPDRAIDPSQPLTLDDALLLGTRLHRSGALAQAAQIYQSVLEAAPEHPDALQFMGVLEHQRRRPALALAYMERCLAKAPDAPGPHQNLGNILLELQRFDEAASAYERCVALGGRSAELLTNIGLLRRRQERFDAAAEAYREAVALDPNSPVARSGYGHALYRLGRRREALMEFSEALARNPKNADSHHLLGVVYTALGRTEDAAKAYRAWLDAEPDNATARHFLAACTGEGVPPRASDAHIEAAFDSFAGSFEARLQSLGYDAPSRIGHLVARAYHPTDARLQILDAGCGTGLCGPFLRPFAARLVGVDLSQQMLTRASQRAGEYDALIKGELTAFIEAHPRTFDLIVCADTLCYFGALDAMFAASHAALLAGGRMIFTVEAIEGEGPAEGFILQANGRYRQSLQYVTEALSRAGFSPPAAESIVVRTEGGLPVPGYLITALR